MIEIIAPSEFKTIPWKNGKGETIEVAINKGGTLDKFDWRLSMASVVEDGEFSDFSGYFRNLVLIKGRDIELHHDNTRVDRLIDLLDLASFDGGCTTLGKLNSGPITDFNVITNSARYDADVSTYLERQSVELAPCDLCFVYCLDGRAILEAGQSGEPATELSAGHLLQMSALTAPGKITGQKMIVIRLIAK